MFPWELREYIKNRNYSLNMEETKIATDVNVNTYLNHITYNVWDNSYDMWDRDGNLYHFVANGK